MKRVTLLDCTLRDGGYLNDWEFGHDTLISILERLVSTNVEVIEVGFIDDRRKYDINRSIFPDTASIGKTYGMVDKGNAMMVGMIDFGTCAIENIQPCEESYIDGIRVIFKEHLMYDAIKYCKQIKDLGYKVFTQMVSVTSYTDERLVELMGLVNELKPYAVSMVDTYGLLHQDNLMHIFEVMDAHLIPEVAIGYHSHNNFQMGYANCIEFLSKQVDREILVDGTLYGMGKSAGNTPLELLAMHMNRNYDKNYDVNQMLEAIEINIFEIQKTAQWGYNLFYYVSASNKCHPNYVSYLMNKRTLSIRSINEILEQIPFEIKLLYDQKCIEKLYIDYQKQECDDTEALKKLSKELKGKKVVIFGPGKSIKESTKQIGNYLRTENPIVLSINYLPKNFRADFIFLSNAKRYVQISSELLDEKNKELQIIATSNVTKTQGRFDYKLDYSAIIDEETDIPDNSLIMLLKVLKKIGTTDIALIGFDGYSESEMNYFNTNMEYDFAKNKASYLNNYVRKFLSENKSELNITFVTKSKYQE